MEDATFFQAATCIECVCIHRPCSCCLAFWIRFLFSCRKYWRSS